MTDLPPVARRTVVVRPRCLGRRLVMLALLSIMLIPAPSRAEPQSKPPSTPDFFGIPIDSGDQTSEGAKSPSDQAGQPAPQGAAASGQAPLSVVGRLPENLLRNLPAAVALRRGEFHAALAGEFEQLRQSIQKRVEQSTEPIQAAGRIREEAIDQARARATAAIELAGTAYADTLAGLMRDTTRAGDIELAVQYRDERNRILDQQQPTPAERLPAPARPAFIALLNARQQAIDTLAEETRDAELAFRILEEGLARQLEELRAASQTRTDLATLAYAGFLDQQKELHQSEGNLDALIAIQAELDLVRGTVGTTAPGTSLRDILTDLTTRAGAEASDHATAQEPGDAASRRVDARELSVSTAFHWIPEPLRFSIRRGRLIWAPRHRLEACRTVTALFAGTCVISRQLTEPIRILRTDREQGTLIVEARDFHTIDANTYHLRIRFTLPISARENFDDLTAGNVVQGRIKTIEYGTRGAEGFCDIELTEPTFPATH